ncbi:phosphoribosylanthranilate isomerase [Staphylococcus hyicus]|uniref:phosphoribosylanthranilate isomerase n=1 Tax=Staphylococcus hyicus TaxID=1284 RepID=UPI00208E4FA3|nr:phosphoribosylanthranilate isomerase [Staphylococcus hyicus]MCO4332297.1 phosphoribosylanthranilate isomerase [Staphylococcus hyicus]MCO4333228.1 phosphoribosylanthranilate isomerase [Staphylococcus hyicus]
MYLKLCGFTREVDVQAACQMDIDALGFVTFPKSQRYVDFTQLAKLTKHIPEHVDRVAVTVNMPYAHIEQIIKCTRVNTLQLHGDETIYTIQRLRAHNPEVQIFKALHANDELMHQIEHVAPYVDKIIVDTPTSMFGGSGQPFDWHKLKQLSDTPVVVAGGVNYENIHHLLTSYPFIEGVDIASGIESDKGIKDTQKMMQIVETVKGVLK